VKVSAVLASKEVNTYLLAYVLSESLCRTTHCTTVLCRLQCQPQARIKEGGDGKSLCCYKLSLNWQLPTSKWCVLLILKML